MKKRIFAASMASVMALSSVSVVAFADETIADFGEAVTRSELKEYVKSFDKFIEDDIYDYGTVQSERFQDAYDYAVNVMEDSRADEKDFTAAYQMLKTVRERMEKKTAADLEALLNEHKSKIDDENILNEDLGDHIYVQSTYDAFVTAYEAGETFVENSDGRLVTDAWYDLKEAVDALEELDDVKKSEFRTVLQQYEEIIKSFKKYENWRRGTFTVNPKTTKGKLTNRTAYGSTFGFLKGVIYDRNWGWINTADTNKTVEEFIKDEYDRFDKIKTSSVTTDEVIVAAYNAAVDAVNIFKGWKADNTEKAVQADVQKIIDSHRTDMVLDFVYDRSDEDFRDVIATVGTYTDKQGVEKPILVFDDKTATIKAQADFMLNIDSVTRLMVVDTSGNYDPDVAEGTELKKIGKGQDIMKYIPVTSDDVQAAMLFQKDYEAAVDYINARSNENAGVYDFNNKLAAAQAAVADVAAAAALGTPEAAADQTQDVVLDALADSAGNNIVASPTTLNGYKLTADASKATKDALEAYNAAVNAAKKAYDALAKANTGLVAKTTAAETVLGTLKTYETVAKDLSKTTVAYDNAVKDVNAFLKMKAPENTQAAANPNTPATTLATDLLDIDGKTALVEAGTYNEVEDDGSGTSVAAEIAAYNAAYAKFDAAYKVLTGTSDGAVTDVIDKIKAFYSTVFARYLHSFVYDRLGNLNDSLRVAEAYIDTVLNKSKDYTTAYTVMKSASVLTSVGSFNIDENNVVADTPTGSRTEWTLAYRALKYALDDLYPTAEKEAIYTKADVNKLIDECYILAEKTGDAAIFNEEHMALVDGRKAALEWIKEANADKKYKEGNAVATYVAEYNGLSLANDDGEVSANATQVYLALKSLYNDLDAMLKAYPVSYGEVAELIAEVGTGLDDGIYKNVDGIAAALKNAAEALSIHKACDDENQAFTTDREFLPYNRVHADSYNGVKPTEIEKALYDSYQALEKAIEDDKKAEEPDVVLGDFNGDGKVDATDALAVLKAYANQTTLTDAEKKAADYNKDGIVDAKDALAILKAYAGIKD